MQVEVGAVLEGKVTGIVKFGAFVELPGGKSGLIHISEVSTDYVTEVSEHLSEGQKIKVKVIGCEDGKISLSAKQVMLEEKKAKPKRKSKTVKNNDGGRKPPEEFSFKSGSSDMSFDDMLQKFKQDSDEKFQDLKRSNEGKRSGGYKRS